MSPATKRSASGSDAAMKQWLWKASRLGAYGSGPGQRAGARGAADQP